MSPRPQSKKKIGARILQIGCIILSDQCSRQDPEEEKDPGEDEWDQDFPDMCLYVRVNVESSVFLIGRS